MKNTILTSALLVGTLGLNSAFASTAASADLQQAQALVKQFGGQLKPELQKAMKTGGPVAAIKVCSEKAPAIAKSLAESSGWEISRVSLKPRGEHAMPDSWEKGVFEKFEQQKANGQKIKELQFSEVVETDGVSKFRFMQAIGTGKVCLNCHGAEITEPVKQALNEYYPADKATGFNKGDIRGAFSFSKQVKK